MTVHDIADVWKWFSDVERGVIALTPLEPPAEVFAGNVRYQGSDGSIATIFNDCNEWDYLDAITFADGRSFTYDDLESLNIHYRPSADVSKERYGI